MQWTPKRRAATSKGREKRPETALSWVTASAGENRHESRLTESVVGGVTSSSTYNGHGVRMSRMAGKFVAIRTGMPRPDFRCCSRKR